MLIAALSNQQGIRGLGVHINARDKLHRSPLHYACCSGRPESVHLLLAAGADTSVQDENDMTLLNACIEFEEGQALWADYRRPTAEERNELGRMDQSGRHEAAAGIMIRDRMRPFVNEGSALNAFEHGRSVPAD